MKNRLQFQEKLSGILTLAEDQGKRITTQEVDAYFESDQLTKDQFDLVYDYLLSQKVVVKGYEKSGGMLKEKNREETIAYTEEEEKYLQIYEQDLQGIPKEKEGEREKLLGQVMNQDVAAKSRLIELYLPEVLRVAKEHHHPQIFLGDMVQEGNMSLILAIDMVTDVKESQGFILSEIRGGMQALMEEQADVKQRDQRMIEKVNYLVACREELTKEMGREVTGEELSAYMNLSEEEMMDILKLAETPE